MGTAWIKRTPGEMPSRACLPLLPRRRDQPFLHRIVRCDGNCILFGNCKRSAQCFDEDKASIKRHSPKPNIHQKRLIVPLVIQHWYDPLQPYKTRSLNYSRCLSSPMNEIISVLANKQLKLNNKERPILLQDSARPHVAQTTLLKLQTLDLETPWRPPYSLDLLPTNCTFSGHWNTSCKESLILNAMWETPFAISLPISLQPSTVLA